MRTCAGAESLWLLWQVHFWICFLFSFALNGTPDFRLTCAWAVALKRSFWENASLSSSEHVERTESRGKRRTPTCVPHAATAETTQDENAKQGRLSAPRPHHRTLRNPFMRAFFNFDKCTVHFFPGGDAVYYNNSWVTRSANRRISAEKTEQEGVEPNKNTKTIVRTGLTACKHEKEKLDDVATQVVSFLLTNCRIRPCKEMYDWTWIWTYRVAETMPKRDLTNQSCSENFSPCYMCMWIALSTFFKANQRPKVVRWSVSVSKQRDQFNFPIELLVSLVPLARRKEMNSEDLFLYITPKNSSRTRYFTYRWKFRPCRSNWECGKPNVVPNNTRPKPNFVVSSPPSFQKLQAKSMSKS